MKKRQPTAGERIIRSAKQALASARGKATHECVVHVPEEIDVKAIRERTSLSQGESAKLFGLSKRNPGTLGAWETSSQWSGSGLPDGNRARTGRGPTRAARLRSALGLQPPLRAVQSHVVLKIAS